MTLFPADYWAKRAVELVAVDRQHIRFSPRGETLDISIDSSAGDELVTVSLPAGMVHYLVDAITAWQGSGKLVGDSGLCTCEPKTSPSAV